MNEGLLYLCNDRKTTLLMLISGKGSHQPPACSFHFCNDGLVRLLKANRSKKVESVSSVLVSVPHCTLAFCKNDRLEV